MGERDAVDAAVAAVVAAALQERGWLFSDAPVFLVGVSADPDDNDWRERVEELLGHAWAGEGTHEDLWGTHLGGGAMDVWAQETEAEGECRWTWKCPTCGLEHWTPLGQFACLRCARRLTIRSSAEPEPGGAMRVVAGEFLERMKNGAKPGGFVPYEPGEWEAMRKAMQPEVAEPVGDWLLLIRTAKGEEVWVWPQDVLAVRFCPNHYESARVFVDLRGEAKPVVLLGEPDAETRGRLCAARRAGR